MSRPIDAEMLERARRALDLLEDPKTTLTLSVGEHPGIHVRSANARVDYAVRGRQAEVGGRFETALDLALLAGTLLGDERTGVAAPFLPGGDARAALALEREAARLASVVEAQTDDGLGGPLSVDLGHILRDPQRRGQAVALPPYRGPGSAPGLSELGERLGRIAST